MGTHADPDCSWLCRMNVNAMDASSGFACDSGGVEVADVVVFAVRQIQDIHSQDDRIGQFSADPKMGQKTGGGANAVVFHQWRGVDVAYAE